MTTEQEKAIKESEKALAAIDHSRLAPEHRERFSKLVESVSEDGPKLSARTRHDTYDGGFDDARHFLSSVVTLINTMCEDRLVELAAIRVALDEIMRIEIDGLTRTYRHVPHLASTLAERAVKKAEAHG